ncbi:hypothetical protein OROMI_013270 [Orobanche minor]
MESKFNYKTQFCAHKRMSTTRFVSMMVMAVALIVAMTCTHNCDASVFNGGCPTGTVRVGTQCVSIDLAAKYYPTHPDYDVEASADLSGKHYRTQD